LVGKRGLSFLSHQWQSKGEKRTILWSHQPDDEIITYLRDMRDGVRYALQFAYRDATRDEWNRLPSPIQLRREAKEWFYSRYSYARHHINPVCRAAIAMLRSYRKNHHGELGIPEVKKLAMRVDAELFKIINGRIRITLQPNQYAWIPINTANRHYEDYSRHQPSELLITDKKVCLTFSVCNGSKPLGSTLMASDLNFNSIDSTSARLNGRKTVLETVRTESTRRMVQIQNDFSRRRRMVQKHVMNL
jgi:putative transposase